MGCHDLDPMDTFALIDALQAYEGKTIPRPYPNPNPIPVPVPPSPMPEPPPISLKEQRVRHRLEHEIHKMTSALDCLSLPGEFFSLPPCERVTLFFVPPF